MLSAIYANKRHNDEGFTLLELLIVVIVIGILAAISLPIFLNQQKAAVDASVQSDVRNSVAELTGAQATHEISFKPTLSRAGTSLALVDSTDTSVSKTVTEGDADVSLPTPAATDAYTLSGYNAGGDKFQGPSVTDGNAFAYDGSTGKFSDGSAPAGSTGSDDPGDSDGYSYLHGAYSAAAFKVNSLSVGNSPYNGAGLQMATGTYSNGTSTEPVQNPDLPLLAQMPPQNDVYSFNGTNVKLYTSAGEQIGQDVTLTCQGYVTNEGPTDEHHKNKLAMQLACSGSEDNGESVPVDAASYQGGRIEFTVAGQTNVLHFANDMDFYGE